MGGLPTAVDVHSTITKSSRVKMGAFVRSFGLLSLLPGSLAAATTGTFDVLTLNVAGLPAFLNGNDVPGDKTENTATVGKLFAKYGTDIIHVQEDFNYHATLYANDNHPQRTPTSGGVPFGSGLNTLSNFPWRDFERVKWEECSEFVPSYG